MHKGPAREPEVQWNGFVGDCVGEIVNLVGDADGESVGLGEGEIVGLGVTGDSEGADVVVIDGECEGLSVGEGEDTTNDVRRQAITLVAAVVKIDILLRRSVRYNYNCASVFI
mmetsp:Transcript_17708/g.29272  ORF Transcript_17708/g.29272 Transcript_17708/m.29272 type:complete len:113 (-) Transcript_17708:274-612(-)